jgi:hypothetical protein
MAVNAFYEVVRPEFKGDHARETVKRWHSFPSELVNRLVRRYLPTSAFRWMLRGQRRAEDRAEETRIKSQLVGEAVVMAHDFLAEGEAEVKARRWGRL